MAPCTTSSIKLHPLPTLSEGDTGDAVVWGDQQPQACRSHIVQSGVLQLPMSFLMTPSVFAATSTGSPLVARLVVPMVSRQLKTISLRM
jgi:hypothetical protein